MKLKINNLKKTAQGEESEKNTKDSWDLLNTAKHQAPQTKTKISLWSIKSKTKQKDAPSESANEEAGKKIEKFPIGASCELKNIELFPVYTSKFKRKQWHLLEKIKELKRLPKTNKIFLSVLIGLTVTGISLLFIYIPEKHNLESYKTNMMDSYHKMSWTWDIGGNDHSIEETNKATPSNDKKPSSHQPVSPPPDQEESQQDYYSRIKEKILNKSNNSSLIDTHNWDISSNIRPENTQDIQTEENILPEQEILSEIENEFFDDITLEEEPVEEEPVEEEPVEEEPVEEEPVEEESVEEENEESGENNLSDGLSWDYDEDSIGNPDEINDFF